MRQRYTQKKRARQKPANTRPHG